jgi:L-asparagine oxygenase
LLKLKPDNNNKILKIIEIHIPYDSARKLFSAFSHLKLSDDNAWLSSKDWFGNTLRHCLPEDLSKRISGFSHDKNQQALIIWGLPIDQNLSRTPYNGYVPSSKLPIVSATNIGLYQLANIEPVSYQSENDALLFRHVIPSISARNDKSSHGSKHSFGHHVDNPDLPLSSEKVTDKSACPEFLSLMTLRSDLHVKSNFILVDNILN